MQHLDFDAEVAIRRLKGIIASKREFKRGVYNDGLNIFKDSYIVNASVSKCNDEGLYSETWSMINLVLEFTGVKMNMLNIPENNKYKLDLVLLPALEDNKFPEMLEIKMFGAIGKPASVAIDRDTGDVYLFYIDSEDKIVLLQFAQLNSVDKEFIISDSSMIVTYEFGIDRKSLYAFITREYGWENLRNNLFIRFNTSPFVRVTVGNSSKD